MVRHSDSRDTGLAQRKESLGPIHEDEVEDPETHSASDAKELVGITKR